MRSFSVVWVYPPLYEGRAIDGRLLSLGKNIINELFFVLHVHFGIFPEL